MITYSNAKNADFDIEIYVTKPRYGLDDPRKIVTHKVRRSRTGYLVCDHIIQAGSKIGVLAVSKGVEPQSLAVQLVLQAIEAAQNEYNESYNGDFTQWM
jgi:hypothetical protein